MMNEHSNVVSAKDEVFEAGGGYGRFLPEDERCTKTMAVDELLGYKAWLIEEGRCI